MAKRSKYPRPALGDAPRGGGRPLRDPVTRLLLFCELMALGLVAASIYLKFPNDLARQGMSAITLDDFADTMGKATFIAVHTRTPWITLSLISVVTAVIAFQTRRKPARNKLVTFAPLAVLLVIGLHAAGQGWLQVHGDLRLSKAGPVPPGMQSVRELPLPFPDTASGTSTGAASGPAAEPPRVTISVQSIQHLLVKEGGSNQWALLFGGDFLFSVPVFFAWLLSFRPPARNVA